MGPGNHLLERLRNGIALPDAEATAALGRDLASLLPPGTALLLSGDLGAGKTTLTAGLARGLGVRETVKSPTFQYFATYRGRDRFLVHLDAYRIGGPHEVDSLLLEDILEEPWLLVVEWPENTGGAVPGVPFPLRLDTTAGGGRVARATKAAG